VTSLELPDRLLLGSGPSPVPERVLRAISRTELGADPVGAIEALEAGWGA
jgi:aspartate aminotransferase-like enzyme